MRSYDRIEEVEFPLVWGKNDPFFSSRLARRLQQAFPDATTGACRDRVGSANERLHKLAYDDLVKGLPAENCYYYDCQGASENNGCGKQQEAQTWTRHTSD